jgi:uncharacterized protein (TIGR03083 family)
MSERAYAGWVAEIAETLVEDRRALIAFARQAPPEFWELPSAVDGWTNHDVLAHVSGGNDQLVQIALRGVISRKPLGPEMWSIDTDAANARGVAARRGWPIERVISELEDGGEELRDLLSELSDDDRTASIGSPTMRLGDFLRIVGAERHDREHLRDLRGGDGGG